MGSEREHFCFESTVRGHHVYKRIWTPIRGEILQTITKRNEHDRFAVAVKKEDKVCQEKFPRWLGSLFDTAEKLLAK